MELSNRDALERKFAIRLRELSRRHADQLARLLGRPPNPANVPESFWVRVKQEQEDEMQALMLLIFLASADQHATAAGVPVDQSLVNRMEVQGVAFSRSRANQVATGFVQHSRDMLGNAAQRWRDRIEAGNTVTQAEVDGDLESLFGRNRMDGIAVNETTQAQYVGGDNVIRATVGISQKDRWFTRADRHVCPICSPLHRTLRDVWEREYPEGPPAHPNCRCWIEWEFEQAGPRTKGGQR